MSWPRGRRPGQGATERPVVNARRIERSGPPHVQGEIEVDRGESRRERRAAFGSRRRQTGRSASPGRPRSPMPRESPPPDGGLTRWRDGSDAAAQPYAPVDRASHPAGRVDGRARSAPPESGRTDAGAFAHRVRPHDSRVVGRVLQCGWMFAGSPGLRPTADSASHFTIARTIGLRDAVVATTGEFVRRRRHTETVPLIAALLLAPL